MLFSRRNVPGFAERVREWLWPRQGLTRTMRYYGHRFGRMQGSPRRIAAGIASGVAMSFMPLGLHVVMALVLAFIVRGSPVAAVLSTVVVGNPVVVTLLLAADLKLGQWLLGGVAHPAVALQAHWSDLFLHPIALIGSIGVPFMVGAAILSLLAWVATFFSARRFIFELRERKLARHAANDD